MDTGKIAQALVKEAETNPASNAVFHVFSCRIRARNSIKLNNLVNKMRKEKFKYPKKEYIQVIKLLSDIGLGTLQLDKKGNIIGIENIKVTVQSIGSVACKEKKLLDTIKSRNTYKQLVSSSDKLKTLDRTSSVSLNIKLNLNNKIINLPLPSDISNNDLIELIKKIHHINQSSIC